MPSEWQLAAYQARRTKYQRAEAQRKIAREDVGKRWEIDEELQKEREASANVKIRLTREDIMGQHGQGF
ncbi:MAG TPA: hypothetical protein VNG71_04470 [Pyrinomonadaceae bacterium]|nr:hypothetical protein [Pyrinomonadaceae bacterium]